MDISAHFLFPPQPPFFLPVFTLTAYQSNYPFFFHQRKDSCLFTLSWRVTRMGISVHKISLHTSLQPPFFLPIVTLTASHSFYISTSLHSHPLRLLPLFISLRLPYVFLLISFSPRLALQIHLLHRSSCLYLTPIQTHPAGLHVLSHTQPFL